MDNEVIYELNGNEHRGWVINDRQHNGRTEFLIVDNPNYTTGGVWVHALDCWPAVEVPEPSQTLACFV